MKKLILLLIFFVTFTSFATNITEKNIDYYSNGNVKTKLFKYEEYSTLVKYYETGKIQEIGYFDLSGNKTGHWLSFYDNGRMMSEANFKNGRKHGEWKSYDTNGKMIVFIKYKRGQKILGCLVNDKNELVVR